MILTFIDFHRIWLLL